MATDTVSNGENFAQHLSRNSDDDVICPTCDVKIKRSQVADHCQVEMERLHNPISAVTPPTPTSGATASEESGSVSGADNRGACSSGCSAIGRPVSASAPGSVRLLLPHQQL